MLSKNEIKYIQSLHHKKERQAHQLFLVEGVKAVLETIKEKKFQIKDIYATENFEFSSEVSIPFKRISNDELNKISTLQQPNQVLAIVKMPEQSNISNMDDFILLLDGIQDPGNMGTIFRTADWFGIQSIICSHDCVEWSNPKVIQATMGSFLRIAIQYAHLSDWLQNYKGAVLGALLNGKSVYEQHWNNIKKQKCLLIGNEGQGIRKDNLPYITHPIAIPKIGGAESLNAGIATGILLSHLVEKGL